MKFRESFFLAAIFALLLASVLALPVVLMQHSPLEPGDKVSMTQRVPYHQSESTPILATRGQLVTQATADQLSNSQKPSAAKTFVALFFSFFIAIFLSSMQIRRTHAGKLLRTQTVLFSLLLVFTVLCQSVLLLTTISPLAMPFALITVVAFLAVDIVASLTLAFLAAIVAGWMTPFDTSAMVVVLIQGAAAPVILSLFKRHSKITALFAGGVAGILSGVAFVGISKVNALEIGSFGLTNPAIGCLLSSGLSAWAAALALPLFEWSLAEVPRSKLVELEDLSNPLLVQISSNSPGTWQHSLAMANMAEICANAIGANGRLVRVGAYYHDLGKSFQPKYFIENKQEDQKSPHETLPAIESCKAIFAHVTDGIKKGREAGLPERIIDFMHMHHGNGLLEYFWHKCQKEGNPEELVETDFRYPGVPPQSKETAILAIVDAVEAASRTLSSPDEQSIKALVQRIVYGKLDLGQLDDSGLTMSDLRKISESLCNTIKHAHHGRIKYPWQKEEEARSSESQEPVNKDGETSLQRPTQHVGYAPTQRLAVAPLDSADQVLKTGDWGVAVRRAMLAEEASDGTVEAKNPANDTSKLTVGKSIAGAPPDTVAPEKLPDQA